MAEIDRILVEEFGVEADPFSKVPTFFYGEPIEHDNGDHSCRQQQPCLA